MRILINASTLVVGGGVQVGINFIRHTLKIEKHVFYYILSKRVYEQIYEELPSEKFTLLAISPAKFFKGRKSKRKILSIEKEFRPDMVYSIGAPSYINFFTPEVLRLTNPMIIGGTKIAFTTYSLKKKILEKLSLNAKRLFISKKDYIITQTEAAKYNIVKNIGVNKDNIYVISNVYSTIFDRKPPDDEIAKEDGVVKILTFSAPYLHKNLDIIPEVASILVQKGYENFKFIVTLPPDLNPDINAKFHYLSKKYNVEKQLVNIGRVDFKKAPDLYFKSEILFLPTLMEIFSVTYLEAMATSTPIVTTNLPFATEVCGDAALYYKPKQAEDAALCIEKLLKSKKERDELIIKGKKQLSKFPKEYEIYNKHIDVLEEVYKKVKNKWRAI